MNIDEISGPKIPDAMYPPVRKRKIEPVAFRDGSAYINASLNGYDCLDLNVQDRVTISEEARRRFRKLSLYMSSGSKTRTVIVP